jgi:methyl-accepting chemotaxis protein
VAHYGRLLAEISARVKKHGHEEDARVVFVLLAVDLMVSMLVYEELTATETEQRRVEAAVLSARQLASTITLFNQASKSIARLSRNSQRTEEGTHVISAAAEQMAASIHSIANNAADLSSSAARTRESMVNAQALATSTNERIAEIARSATAMSTCVSALTATTAEISQIIGVISKIAEQTKMLALNATIEAARAGDAGKGFGVVAGEIKTLARSVSSAADDITSRIERLTSSVAEIDERTAASVKETQRGSQTVEEVRACLGEVVEQVSGVAGAVQQISSILEQQELASTEIAKNIANIAKLERDSNALVAGIARETRATNEALTSVTTFGSETSARVMIERAKIDHVLFKKRIVDVLLGGVTAQAKDLPDHHGCRFGKWFDAATDMHGVEGFRELEGPHREVHAQAVACLRHFEANQHDAAIDSLEAMELASNRLMAQLETIAQRLSTSEQERPLATAA